MVTTTARFTISKLGVEKFEMLLHPQWCFIFTVIDPATEIRLGDVVENPHPEDYTAQLQEARDWADHIDNCTEGCVELTAELVEAIWV